MNELYIYAMFVVVWCYLLGSIPTGFWVVKAVLDKDIRQFGSGNIGMTNVWRVAGAKWGILTLILDILKGVLAVWIGGWYFEDNHIRVLAAVSVLVGNLFPVFLKFKGGKGVGTSVGVFFYLLPIQSLIGLVAFALVFWRWRMVSLGSLAGVTVMALVASHQAGIEGPAQRLALAACLLVWWSHRSNLGRILDGTEKTVGSKKDTPPTVDASHEGLPS